MINKNSNNLALSAIFNIFEYGPKPLKSNFGVAL